MLLVVESGSALARDYPHKLHLFLCLRLCVQELDDVQVGLGQFPLHRQVCLTLILTAFAEIIIASLRFSICIGLRTVSPLIKLLLRLLQSLLDQISGFLILGTSASLVVLGHLKLSCPDSLDLLDDISKLSFLLIEETTFLTIEFAFFQLLVLLY